MDETLRTGSEVVLLVDDEEIIVDVGSAMLEKLGYRVLVARGGEAAVDVLREHADAVELVILDLIMPGLDGGRTFDRIRELRPGLPVILSSGYSIDGKAADILRRGCNGFLQKPFNMLDLSKKVREVLDAARSPHAGAQE